MIEADREVCKKCNKILHDALTTDHSVSKASPIAFWNQPRRMMYPFSLLVTCLGELSVVSADTSRSHWTVPCSATTHSDLLLRAKEMNIEVGVVHNASIMNAISCCGLQLYRFGEAVSIPFFTDTWRPGILVT